MTSAPTIRKAVRVETVTLDKGGAAAGLILSDDSSLGLGVKDGFFHIGYLQNPHGPEEVLYSYPLPENPVPHDAATCLTCIDSDAWDATH